MSGTVRPPVQGTFPTAATNKATTHFDGYYPLGFRSELHFRDFVIDLYQSCPTFDATLVFQGSSVAGRSMKLKEGSNSYLFDAGRVSDYDITIVSKELFDKAKGNPGIGIKIKDDHTQPLKDGPHLAFLKLTTMQANADARITNYSTARREINFMIYETLEAAFKHTGPSLVCPEPSQLGSIIRMETYIGGEKNFNL